MAGAAARAGTDGTADGGCRIDPEHNWDGGRFCTTEEV